ncbi:hypothetical protein PHLGIDRAFT_130897 [Phlebiopsis gigantea 11061_1 CR5-6]|uniref:J domain-containing protein n=1 Tax=Phlebiopsis gigantea (strain 11061_1 CR5-6) TaxID=745531 RepID=A0A0C3RZY7_PHLG1|nr:hypothetical protein PHLGIDRAFT_130897 [Phlebiopsis gigantea 11061_1 CR5-6]
MSGIPSEDLHDPHLSQHEYLYTVLNLPTTATKEEIRDRYRQLSLVFHPDKQHGKPTQETALKRFLEVQKAYEILSDPVTRQAYDLHGLEGVRLARRSSLAGLTSKQIEKELAWNKAESDWKHAQNVLQSVGDVSLGVDARALLAEIEDDEFNELPASARFWARVTSIRLTGVGVQNTIEKSITELLTFTVSSLSRVGPVGHQVVAGERHVDGTLRYQHSPWIRLEASTSLFRARNLTLGGTFDDGDNTVTLKAYFSPAFVNGFSKLPSTSGTSLAKHPPISLSLRRRLFPRINTFGIFEITTQNAFPTLTFALTSAKRLHLIDNVNPSHTTGAPSRFGLAVCVGQWSAGMTVMGWLPALFMECGVVLAELGVQLKARLESGLQTTNGVITASWSAEPSTALSEVGFDVGVGTGGVFLKLNATYMNQAFHVPITMSSHYDTTATMWTTVVPTTAAVLAYHLVLRPLWRKERFAFFRQARHELREAKSDIVRAAEETVSLLRDTARRHSEAEASRDGLVIVDARYGPTEYGDDAVQGLDVDVTIPLQALVNNSQLYIPGGRSKSGLQGFYDPVPSVHKTVRVRYTFRGRPHYAEIADLAPLVLPLEEHLVS